MNINRERNDQIFSLRDSGARPCEIARCLNVSRGVVAGVLNRAGIVENENKANFTPRPRRFGSDVSNAKLTEQAVREIRRRRRAGEAVTSIARAYGISHQNVGKVVGRLTWAHVQ